MSAALEFVAPALLAMLVMTWAVHVVARPRARHRAPRRARGGRSMQSWPATAPLAVLDEVGGDRR